MRAVLLEVPEELLAERRRRGWDVRDEMWEGVLHVVPSPSGWHQDLAGELAGVLRPIAALGGLRVAQEMCFYRSKDSYRVPDIAVYPLSHVTDHGVEGGAPLAIEVLSPNDETYEKFPFFAAFPVREVLVIEPKTRRLELHALREGKLEPVAPDASGRLRLATLDVTLETVATEEGPRILVTGGGVTSRL